MTSNPYQGLINEGSTCYLNSLIQTLFMTPQFRKNVYAYVHNSKKLQAKNSIPYHLQRLFVLLQTSKTKLVSTRGLLKSFQWTEADAFQQHDVQQFCRKLFQAIQISNKKAHWITDLFQGSMVSYVDCGKHLSQKQQIFMDISLSIHNPYTKVKFSSLEECLKEYLKSQKLQDKFFCQQCGDKVEVHKGMKIYRLPPLLTIQLNRFQLNYQTWQRQKINDFLYFPEVLYMGKFMKKYQDMEISEIPAELKSKIKIIQKQKSARTTDMFSGMNNIKPPTSAQVPKVKPKRKNSDEIESQKTKVFFFDQQSKRQKQQKKLTLQEQKDRNRQILADLKSEKSQIDEKWKKVQKLQKKQVVNNVNLQDDMLFGSGMGFLVDDGPLDWNVGAFDKTQTKPKFSKAQIIFEHQQQQFNPQKQYPQNTYALYAVLVHSGGAYGGHYFAFISNGKQWFRFDDSIVRKVDRHEMRKYGNLQKIQSGSNAYLLFYRDVRTFKDSNPDEIEIPEQLLQKVNNDKDPVTVYTDNGPKLDNRFQKIVQGVMLKLIYIPIQDDPQQQQIQLSTLQPKSLFIDNRYEQTIGSLKQRLLSLYPQLQILGEDNWRLRRYNKLQQSLHEVYTNKYDNQCLQNIGFRQTVYVAIETKSNDQLFEDYDPKQITVKVNLWRPDITLVTQKHLKPIKMHISQQAPFTQLVKKIQQKFTIQNPVIIKRNFSQSKPIQIYPNQQTKRLIQLKFFNGINLYVQQPFVDNKSRWVNEFQSQKYRCSIKFNNPNNEIIESSQLRDCEIYFDTRKTLKQLKQQLSKLINLPIEQFRIKKTRQSVSQLINYNKKLHDLKFIANQYLYLQKGRSSCGVVILKQGKVQIIDDRIEFSLGAQVIIQLDENTQTVGDIIKKLAQQFSISQKLIRIRQFKAFQFGEIYRHTESIQKIKQKSIAWQKLPSQDVSDMRGMQLYIRVFDINTMELGQLRQIYVDNAATYQQLAMLISQQLSIKINKILIWKALSNYVQKSILIDCDWIQLAYIKRQIKQQPLYIMNDGEIFIVKQADKEYHPKVNYYSVGGSTGGGVERNKQAQLKITVMAQNSDQEEEMMNQALTASLAENSTKDQKESVKQQPTKQ